MPSSRSSSPSQEQILKGSKCFSNFSLFIPALSGKIIRSKHADIQGSSIFNGLSYFSETIKFPAERTLHCHPLRQIEKFEAIFNNLKGLELEAEPSETFYSVQQHSQLRGCSGWDIWNQGLADHNIWPIQDRHDQSAAPGGANYRGHSEVKHRGCRWYVASAVHLGAKNGVLLGGHWSLRYGGGVGCQAEAEGDLDILMFGVH